MAAIIQYNRKVKASTLIEVVAATVIIMLVLGISAIIFFSVISSSDNFQRVRATTLLNEVSKKTIKEYQFVDEEFVEEGFLIKRTVSNFNNVPDVLQLKLQIYNSEQKLIGERIELVLAE